jgi:hypothetical protein
MNELIEHISFQRRICENQLNAYKSIMNESHPKYKLLKKEYEAYVLLEDISKDLENVDASQIEIATQILNKTIEDFKNSLTVSINEFIKQAFNKAKNIVRGLTTGHDINQLEKEKNIKDFMIAYQVFKPIATAASIIYRMAEKAESQGDIINQKTFQSLKLSGSEGNEIKQLIVNIASGQDQDKIERLKKSCQIIQNVISSASTNPVISNFISNDLVQNPINVGLKNIEGGTHVGTYLRSKSSHEVPGEVNLSDIKDDDGFGKDLMPNAVGGDTQSQSMFGSNAANGPYNNLNTGFNQSSTRDNKSKRMHDDLRKVANDLGISKQEQDKMEKSGIFRYIKSNPDLLSQLISAYKNPSSSLGPAINESGKQYLVRLVKEHKQEGTLVTEVVNKWNKLAGIK